MVSLFGLTGAFAPVALINLDKGQYADRFIEALNGAHHSFALKYVSPEEAEISLHSGRLVGIITIPEGFSSSIERGITVPIDIRIDNVNLDLTNDVQRALPAAIVAFGRRHNFPGVRVVMAEHPVNKHDTGYIPYLIVSALALDAMVIAGILEWSFHGLRVTPEPVYVDLLILAGIAAVASALTPGSLARGGRR